ncbi:MAG: hypothetical protein ACLUEF_03030 [Faecalibacterium prausnitzii]
MEEDRCKAFLLWSDEMLQDGMKVIAVARKEMGQQNQITPADEARS